MRLSWTIWIALALVGCGGGGSLPAPGTPVIVPEEADLFSFSGVYRQLGMAVFDDLGTARGFASLGRGAVDRAGYFAGTLGGNVDGAPFPTRPVDAEYSADPRAQLRWDAAPGAMSADARIGAMTSPGFGSLALLLDRRDRGFDAATLDGPYRYAFLSVSTSGTSVVSSVGVTRFDGAGGVTLDPEVLNSNGMHVGTASEMGTYTVNTCGDVSMDLGVLLLEGGLDTSGEVLVLAGGTRIGDEPFLMLLVPETGGATNALLSGDYTVVGMEYDATGRTPRSLLGTLVPDGAGDAEITLPFPDILTTGTVETLPTRYSVQADGRMDVVMRGNSYRGAITSTGDVAILGGGVVDGDNPAIAVLIRRRVPATIPEGIGPDPFQSGVLTLSSRPGSAVFATSLYASRALTVETSTSARALTSTRKKGVLRFSLSSIPPGATVTSAALVTTQTEVRGAPYAGGRALEVDHVDLGLALDAADWDPPRRPAGALIGSLSVDSVLGMKSLDVTSAVVRDLADGRETVDFLLDFPGDPTDTAGAVLDDQTGPGAIPGTQTRLRITFAGP